MIHMKKAILKFLKYSGILLVLAILFVVFLFLYPTAAPLAQKSNTDNYIISNVHIIDAVHDSILMNKSIEINNNRIVRIFPADSVFKSTNKVIDGKGMYAMSGLWNMHSHLGLPIAPQTVMPLQLANGITNLRDMQGVVRINKERALWQQQINEKKLLGPRIIGFANFQIGSSYDTKDVVKVVNKTAEDKSRFIKIYSNVLKDRYFKLAKEAKKKNVPFAGHYPLSIAPIDASNAGQRSFEHAHLFIDASHPRADKQRKYAELRILEQERDGTLFTSYEDILATFDINKFNELADVMVKNNTYFCPTHVTKQYEASINNTAFLNNENIKYIPSMLKTIWDGDIEGMKKRNITTSINYYKKGLELTGLAHKRGVKILAGTDTNDPYSFPGFTIHTELEQLVKAGLTPGEAIATATINPSEYFHLSKDYGTIETGKIADILLLKNNPLTDIKNTKNIQSIFYNGNIYSRAELDEFQDYVEDNVSGISGLSLTVKMFFSLMKGNNPEARNAIEEQ